MKNLYLKTIKNCIILYDEKQQKTLLYRKKKFEYTLNIITKLKKKKRNKKS